MSVHSRCNLQSICTVRCLTLKTVGKIYEIRSRPTLVPSRLRVLACVKFLSLTCETLRPPHGSPVAYSHLPDPEA